MQVFNTGPRSGAGAFPIKFTGCTSDSNLEYELLSQKGIITLAMGRNTDVLTINHTVSSQGEQISNLRLQPQIEICDECRTQVIFKQYSSITIGR